jgi:hypothetical protein
MSNYSDLVDGLKTVLRDNVTELKVFDYPPATVNSFPAAVILPEPIDVELTFGGNSFDAEFRVIVLLSKGDDSEGFRSLYDLIDPTTANKSVIKAVRDNPTLNGKADDSRVDRIENIGRRNLWGGNYFAFDMTVQALKTVA